MRHAGSYDLPDAPPDPWLMAMALIGSGVTLWWLMPDILRRMEESRCGDARSSRERWSDAVRAYYGVAGRAACTVMVLGGVVLLGIQIAQA